MPTMMLLMGMKISFTKKPMKPMMAKPIEVACAIFENSVRSGFVQRFIRRHESRMKSSAGFLMYSIASELDLRHCSLCSAISLCL